jgi:RNA polymerase sigma-70 factor (ECF subfamily)
MILQLRDVQNYEYDEIAEITGMSINNIRVSLSRARSTLRDRLIKLNRYGTERSK